jgi:integrase/recombinase XerD
MAKTYLEPEDVTRLEQAAEYLRDQLLIRVLFRLGCRVSEATGIKVTDIDFNQGLVTIQHLKQRIRFSCPECESRLSKSHKFCPVCGHKVDKAIADEREHRKFRVLPLDEETMVMLKDYVDRGGVNPKSKLVFDMSRHRAWQIIKECAVKARLPRLINSESGKVHNVSPHKLRDAFAVHAVKHNDSGDGLRLLQEHLGHQSITTTMRYRKVSGEEQKEWYEKLWQGGNNNG